MTDIYFVTVWKLEVQDQGFSQFGFLVRIPFLTGRWLLSSWVFTWPLFSVCAWREREKEHNLSGVFSYKDTDPIRSAATRIPSFNLNYFCKDPVSKYYYTGVRTSTYEFEYSWWRHKHSVHRRKLGGFILKYFYWPFYLVLNLSQGTSSYKRMWLYRIYLGS